MKQNYEIAIKPARKQRSARAEIWRNFKRNRGAIIGLAILGTIVFLAIASEFIFDYDTQVVRQRVSERLQGPSLKYPLGTDQYGRDIMTRIIYGARFSLSVGIVAVMVSLAVGATLGLVAGFYGGVIENLIMRVSDVFGSIPSILLAITISAAFGQSMFVLMVSVGIVSVPAFARVARAAAMTVRDQEYIEAARAAGARDWQIIAYHVIPNSMAPILVQCTMRVASAIIAASSLSFLGLGVPLPAPEWGAMLSEGRGFIRNYSYMTLFPGLAIMITVLAINLIGDGLRDAMDPKLKRR
jgi:peptide/nickel transport system permease protein